MKQRDIPYKLISIILIIGVVVSTFFLILSTMSMYSKGCLIEEDHKKQRETIDSISTILYSKYALIDLPKADSIAHADYNELLKTMLGHIKLVEDRQCESISDLRQESNNIINKVNGWLGFWIALLALFGSILPLIIQYTLYKRSEIRTETLIESTSKKANLCHLQLLVSTICLQYEMGIITDNTKRSDLINIILAEMAISLQGVIKVIIDNNREIDNTNETILINVLIQYGKLIDTLILIDRGERRDYRQFLELRDDLRELLTAILTNHTEIRQREVWNKLMSIYPRLYALYAKK